LKKYTKSTPIKGIISTG